MPTARVCSLIVLCALVALASVDGAKPKRKTVMARTQRALGPTRVLLRGLRPPLLAARARNVPRHRPRPAGSGRARRAACPASAQALSVACLPTHLTTVVRRVLALQHAK